MSRYRLTIETKDVPYELASLQGDVTELLRADNWAHLTIVPLQAPERERA